MELELEKAGRYNGTDQPNVNYVDFMLRVKYYSCKLCFTYLLDTSGSQEDLLGGVSPQLEFPI